MIASPVSRAPRANVSFRAVSLPNHAAVRHAKREATMSRISHIAFLGTGMLGAGFVEAAAGRGETITAWNRTTSKARALEHLGVRVAETPADAVRGAERVHLVLKDDAVVDDVIAAARSALAPDTIIVDHTTNQPALTAARANALHAAGVKYIHCPVFIGPAAARAGQGTIMSSGPRHLFDAIQPALARMAERVEYLGERADLAAVYKLCGNAVIIGTTALVADVLAIATNANVPPIDVLHVADFFNPAATIRIRGKNMATRNYAPSFELDMSRKDVRLMIETAGTRPLCALPGIAARMDTLIGEGEGRKDLGILGKTSV